MAKVTLEWKTPSEKKMAEFIKDKPNDVKKEFALACVERKDGKAIINKAKAKKWLVEKFDGTDEIEWHNRPEKRAKNKSSADLIAEWLDL